MSLAGRTAVVVVTWNKAARVRDCLRSLEALPERGFDLFVVDNASTDGTADMIRREFPEVQLLINAENLGGAGGFNRGMQHALDRGYGFVWLLDNDVTVAPDALAALRRAMAGRPDCGVVGSKIYAAGTGVAFIQELGSFIDWQSAGITLNRNGTFDHGQVTETVEVDYVPACSMLVRAAAVKGLGLFDPSYFLYWDDIDFCRRVALEGRRVLACGESVVNHFSSGERAGTSLTIYYDLRNALYFARRYQPDETAFRACAERRIARAAERAGLFCTLGREELVETMERSVHDGLAMVRGRVDDLPVVPLAADPVGELDEADTLVLVAQRPHIFYQSRAVVERMLGGDRALFLVDGRRLADLAAMDGSNLVGYPDGEFRARSPAMRQYAGSRERVVLLGKDALFPNAVEAALSLRARETLYVDFYGNMIPLTDRTLDEHAANAEAFRSRWLVELERSALVGAGEA
jgi:GT2 family glycosyltransferase